MAKYDHGGGCSCGLRKECNCGSDTATASFPPIQATSEIDRIDAALATVRAELIRATAKFGAFKSAHEGYAVLLEEVDELWDEVKANNKSLAREECVQVAAMAVRFLVDVR